MDIAGRQMNAKVKTAGKAVDLCGHFPFLPLAELTREGVKSYVDAQKALIDVCETEGRAQDRTQSGTSRQAVAKETHASGGWLRLSDAVNIARDSLILCRAPTDKLRYCADVPLSAARARRYLLPVGADGSPVMRGARRAPIHKQSPVYLISHEM